MRWSDMDSLVLFVVIAFTYIMFQENSVEIKQWASNKCAVVKEVVK
tara:strand:- start:1073 stop:1210 length:138 start_codon:yes stop_codon:yes gene_type:complete